MTDPFAVRPVNKDAVDKAWMDHRWHHLPRINALLDITAAGVPFRDAALVLDSTTLPSTSGLLTEPASTLAEPLPAGVDGFSIAGGTR